MAATEGTITSALLKSFAEGVASEAGGDVGALLLGFIFPSSSLPVDDLAALCDKIKGIVENALTKDDVININGNLTGVLNFVNTIYKYKKNDPTNTKQDLTDALNPYIQPMETAVLGQFLASSDRTQAGFPVYLLAVYSYLSILQEMAMVDPAKDDPWKSDYVKSIKDTMNIHIPWCQTQWATLQANRQNAITVEQSDRAEWTYQGTIGEDCWRWKDTVTGETGDKHCSGEDHPDGVAFIQGILRKQQVLAQLVIDMGDPDSVIAVWQQVVAVPLPLPSIAQINYFTGTWTGNTLTLAWQTTGAVSISIQVSKTVMPFSTDPSDADFNQPLAVEATGTRDFVFDHPTYLIVASLSCEDVHGVQIAKSATGT